MLYLILFVILYYCISIWHFINIIGDKYRKDNWIDYILFLPMFTISYIVGYVLKKKSD